MSAFSVKYALLNKLALVDLTGSLDSNPVTGISSYCGSTGPVGATGAVGATGTRSVYTFLDGGISTGLPDRYVTAEVNFALRNLRSATSTITTSKGAVDLTSSTPFRTLIESSNGWFLPDNKNNSFYPTSFQQNVTGGIGGFQGTAVALSADGNTAAIGAYGDDSGVGATYFTRSGVTWTIQAKLAAVSTLGIQGTSVSLSSDGNTLAVGGVGDNDSYGATWIYTRTLGVWTEQQKLVGTGGMGPPPLQLYQGRSVSLSADGNTVAIGGNGDSGYATSSGATWVFTRSGSIWTQQGSKIVGSGTPGDSSGQGTSVSPTADGNMLAIGGPGDDSKAGAIWIFTRLDSVWTQQTKLTGSGLIAVNSLGRSVAHGISSTDGQVFVFTRSGSTWRQETCLLRYPGDLSGFGTSVCISADGNTIAIGAQLVAATQRGSVSIYTRQTGIWNLKPSIDPGAEYTLGSLFGFSVAFSDNSNTLIIGAPNQNSGVGMCSVYV